MFLLDLCLHKRNALCNTVKYSDSVLLINKNSGVPLNNSLCLLHHHLVIRSVTKSCMLLVWVSGICDTILIGLCVTPGSLMHYSLCCPAVEGNVSFKKSGSPLESFRNIPLHQMAAFSKLDWRLKPSTK